MIGAVSRVLGIATALAVFAGGAMAQQAWETEWKATVAKAKGQTLAIVLQPGEAFESVVQVFQKKYPDIDVQPTIANPSTIAPRLVTEIKNNVFAFDTWWATASNMNTIVLPIGGFEKITDYMILPEVKDESNWQNPKYLYTSDRGPYVFVHTHYLQNLALYNTKMVPGGAITSLDQMLNPALVGKISIRVPSRPHGGTMMLAAMAKQQGPDFVRKLMTDMKPIFLDNDRQNTNNAMKGETAIAIGTAEEVFFECVQQGGCKDVKNVPITFMHSRSVAVMKNAPHKEATKVWINWILSKEGQETYVREWAKYNGSGAFSMRKDVKPDPKHLDSLPDFTKLDQYVAVSLDSGTAELDAITKLYESTQK